MSFLGRRESQTADLEPFEISERALRRGRQLGQLGLSYQPIVDIETGALAGVEALLRCHVPGKGTLAATEFADLIGGEEALSPIDKEALRLATAFRATLPTEGPAAFPVTVNATASDLLAVHAAEAVLRILEGTRLPPSLLELDLAGLDEASPETAVVAASVLRKLRDSGVSIALDGVERLTNPGVVLSELPLDAVKVDVLGIEHGQGVDPSAKLAVRQAQRLGLRVVAKRVETTDQLRLARSLRVQHAQGFLLGEPVPADTFASLVLHTGLSAPSAAERRSSAA